MIFVTIGTQEPFDRLIRAIDELAGMFPDKKFIAQTFNGKYIPNKLNTVSFIEPVEFNRLFGEAELIIGHAGMGTIISALTLGKPIVILPRIAALGEHRNEHQLATAEKMMKLGYVKAAKDEVELKTIVTGILNNAGENSTAYKLGKFASEELVNSLKTYISDLS